MLIQFDMSEFNEMAAKWYISCIKDGSLDPLISLTEIKENIIYGYFYVYSKTRSTEKALKSILLYLTTIGNVDKTDLLMLSIEYFFIDFINKEHDLDKIIIDHESGCLLFNDNKQPCPFIQYGISNIFSMFC